MDQRDSTTEYSMARQWLNRAITARDSHYKQGKILKKQQQNVGIAICVLSAVVGSSIFVSISHAPNTISKILVGTLSIAASVLAGLQTFLNLPEKSEKHRATAIRFSSLVRKLEMIISDTSAEKDATRRSLEDVQKEWDSINYDAPLAPMKVWLPTVEEVNQRQTSGK